MPHDVIFLLVPGFQLLDMSGPAAVFQTAGKQARTTAGPAYAVHVVSERGGPVRSSCGVEVLTRSWRDAPPGTLVVPGGEGARAAAVTPAMRRYLHAHRQAGRRLASVCTGAFVLAAAGLLDGRRATTHWRHAAELARNHPDVSRRRPDPRLRWRYVDLGRHHRRHRPRAGDGRIRPGRGGGGRHRARDGGHHRRSGGQSQFSALQDLAPDSERIRAVLEHIRGNLGAALTVEHLADVAVSPRQFLRSFAETGKRPPRRSNAFGRRRRARTSRRRRQYRQRRATGRLYRQRTDAADLPACHGAAAGCGAWPGKDKKRTLFLSLMTPARKARHPAGTACKTKMGIEL